MIATGNWGTCEWTISDAGELIIGGGAAESVSADGKYPWDEYRQQIRRISFGGTVTGVVSLVGAFMNCTALEEIDFNGIDTSNTVDLSWLLCSCTSLERVDLSMLNTGKVVDMSCMFLSCRNLKEVIFGGIDLSSVMDMSRMFMYCGSLHSLDFFSQDNRSLQMADDLFFGCDGLRALVPGENFSLGGGGRTVIAMPESLPEIEEEENVSDWRTSTDGVLYIAGSEFTVRYDGNGAQPATDCEDEEAAGSIACTAGTQLRACRDLFEVPRERVFKEWNTNRDGSGRSLLPGQLFKVHSDMTLYAIWAGKPEFVNVYDIPEITYGQLLSLEEPEIEPHFAEVTEVRAQISDPSGSWNDFDNEEPLTAARSGSKIRFVAGNMVGQTISEEREITINKASYDMSQVHWVLPEDLTYDGQEKSVRLEGLPEGVTAEYAGNTVVEVGQYTAAAVYHYDEENYLEPQPAEKLEWTISKGKYRMSDLGWSYMEAFTYDGQPKSVRLEGLPEGTTPYYSGADAVDAGTYVATAGLDYDIDNYSSPDPVRPCTWKILKTTHDMSDVHWEGPSVFTYDGSPKKVELSGLPQGLRAEYTGNEAIDAGAYTARAAFVPDDPVNFEIPEPVEFAWEITKADHDMSRAVWTEDTLVYTGQPLVIGMTGIPEGVSVLYEGETGVEAGEYTVRAEFCVEDLNNYNQMDPITKTWRIEKADIDMSKVRWNYSSPYVYNGIEKTVELKNIPEQIQAVSYTGERAIVAGNYTARAEFTYDEYNYNRPRMEDCIWSILKANLKVQDLHWDYTGPFTYDGQEHSVRIIDLPDNAVVSYENGDATGAGNYLCKAHITPTDPDNFNTPKAQELHWEIHKAVFDISDSFWDDEQRRIFDGTAKGIRLRNLPEGVRVSYEGNEATEAGSYRAKAVFAVEDTDNFLPPQPKEFSWDVAPAAIDLSGISWNYREPFVYDGSEKEIILQGLPEGVTARYTGNVASEAGEYSAQAVLIPPEESSFRETEILGKVWRIEKADIDVSEVRWNCPDDFVYDGLLKGVCLENVPDQVKVVYAGHEAVNAGTYQAEASLIPYDTDNFNVPEVAGCTWSIARAGIDISQAVWSGYDTFAYDGTVHRVLLKDLPETVEASYEGNAAVDAGNYIANARFAARDPQNYEPPHPLQYEWSIAKAQIRAENVYWTSGGDDLVYDGGEHGIWLAGLPQGVKAVAKGNTAVNAGQYIASAVLEPEDYINYLPFVVEPYRWEISRAEIDISDVMWASSGELVYDGTMKVVGLTGLSDDISVEYENNVAVEAGTYHASAVLSTSNQNYTAPEIEGCTWTIAKAVPDISGVTWSYAFEFTYDGYEKSVELLDLPEGMTARYTGNAAIEAGEYVAEATLIMEDSMNYEAPQVSPLTWRIGKRDYDMSQAVWIGAEGFVYDGTAKSVELSGLEEGLEPIYQDNVAVDAGVYTASARFLYDEDNYNPPQDLTCSWEIRKAPLDTSGIRWDYSGPIKANGRLKTVSLLSDGPEQGLVGKMFSRSKEQNFIGLPQGTTVRYEGNSAKAPGVYEARAYLTIPPQPNHEVTEPLVLIWEITND
ncbi:MAG: BspA family leucine-rich repeat surface protein [Firmicutes bacterium]|nr:BspA family leucine-rich repeat surface protein [Bacillota bacterium]